MPRTYNGYLSQSISFIVMTEEALKQEVDSVVWDEQQDVSTSVRIQVRGAQEKTEGV